MPELVCHCSPAPQHHPRPAPAPLSALPNLALRLTLLPSQVRTLARPLHTLSRQEVETESSVLKTLLVAAQFAVSEINPAQD